MAYIDVILPIPLEGTFTYLLPDRLEGHVVEGQRIIVPFGGSKLYTGIVTCIRKEKPKGDFKVKEIIDTIDDGPILLPRQLRLWEWMSDYYLCSEGDVYKAALPSGLKLESETQLELREDFDQWDELKPKELQVYELLQTGKIKTVGHLQRTLKDSRILATVRALMDRGALTIHESLENTFQPRREVHVRLAKAYLSEEALNQLFDTMERTPKRYQLLLKYVEISATSSALTLGNPALIEEVSRARLLKEADVSPAVLTGLRKKGILEVYDFETGRLKQTGKAVSEQLPLSEAQQEACDRILKEFESKQVCLLHGVTSSGKTEIYIRLIRRELEAGRQVLYLLPEIALTTQITTRLSRVFGDQMGVYHSKFPDNERVEIWQKQMSDRPFGLILGVRSSVFLPFRNLGLVIVDEEHETSYKQQDPAPRYNARDTSIVLASLYHAHVLLGTATPSLETFANVHKGKYGYATLTQRYGDMLLPTIEVADVKELLRTKQMKLPFSPRLEEEIQQALDDHEQVILFQNRRGYSPVMECPKCGWVPTCQYCDVSLTYHQEQHRMVCHYCGSTFDVPTVCPNCGEKNLRSYGFGTEKVEEEVHKHFPAARTARLDLDTTRSRNAYEHILTDFAEGRTDILIGTQMVSKGLDFDKVHVVGILDADTMLTRPDFRSFERAFQMMSQVAGRAGRRNKRGYVILQTRRSDYPIIRHVVNNDYTSMYEEQMEERKEFHYPPFYRLIHILLKHRDDHLVDEAARQLALLLQKSFGDRVLGPDKPAISRIQLQYYRKIMLKTEHNLPAQRIRHILRSAVANLIADQRYRAVTVYFDVDPL